MKKENPTKELYQRLRVLGCEELWEHEVAAFDRASPKERMDRVAVVRAVGVVFSESGTPGQKDQARNWLRSLLHDPNEKVRRYAMTALPKVGAAVQEETELLDLLKKTSLDREKKFLGRTLEKIGGNATLEATTEGRLERKAAANLARQQSPSLITLERTLSDAAHLRIHLHCRDGLEQILEDELHEQSLAARRFRLLDTVPGLVAISPIGDLRLADVYALRCFATVGIELGATDSPDDEIEALAKVIASPATQNVLEAFTNGPIRYRLEFVSKGHQRGAVRALADRVFQLCPSLLNDSRDAPWQIDIRHIGQRVSAELTPRLRPDPRFAYRRGDVPAASHPPLAACMARLAGIVEGDVVWDPFCGSGLELIERARRGGVRQVFGTDLSAEAVAIAGENFASAISEPTRTTFVACDFRDHTTVAGLDTGAVSLVISNPPMDRRVPIPDLRGLIEELFVAASDVLKPGGRLVFANPLPIQPRGQSLVREYRQKIDLGGFHVHVEKYVKAGDHPQRSD